MIVHRINQAGSKIFTGYYPCGDWKESLDLSIGDDHIVHAIGVDRAYISSFV